MRTKSLAFALLALSLTLACGCRRASAPALAPSIATVEQLAAALRDHGIAYKVAETAVLPRVGGEGLRLTGPGLDVELYRIPDPKHLETAAAAARMAVEAQQEGKGGPRACFVHGSFLVIIREEPAPGGVQSVLTSIFAG